MIIGCHIRKFKTLCCSYADAESGRIMEVRQQNGGDIGAVVGAELGPGAIVTSAVGALVCSNFLNNNVEQLIEIILSF